ncbi:GCR1-dependent translation factor 1, partial [Vermiconidia calcicola]
MRVRKASPLLLLLAAPTLGHALQIFSEERDALTPRLRKRDAEPELLETKGGIAAAVAEPVKEAAAAVAAAAASAKPSVAQAYKSTKDAPVDGFDGKPHLGPFVQDSPRNDDAATATAKARPTDLDKWTQAGTDEWRLEEVPEKNDGVMNDENRVGPKKGMDGTAGGISEKEKERRLKGGVDTATGNRPQEPKEAPPLPHSEEEYKKEGSSKEGSGEAGRSGTRVVDDTKKGDQKFGAGGYGIDKPENLPEKPHNIPQPGPNTNRDKPAGSEPPVNAGGSKSNWLVDTMPYTEGQKPPPPPPGSGGSGAPAAAALTPLLAADADTWHEWFHSFVLSFFMILFSEIGDKTFLVAALMAMRHPRILVFSAAFGALIVMTVLSAILGHAFPALLPKKLTTFAAAILFLVFGAKSLREGLAMPKDSGVGEEMKEVEAELEEKEHQHTARHSPYTLESGRGRRSEHQHSLKPAEPSPPSSRSPSPRGSKRSGLLNLLSLVLSPAWVQTFVMTFLGEWGDRSQIATIAMAAGQDY